MVFHFNSVTKQETAEGGMVGLQSKFQNLNAKVTKVNQNVDRWTDRQTSSIHKPELLCNPAKNQGVAIRPREV